LAISTKHQNVTSAVTQLTNVAYPW